jgi:hypothetical protein
MEYTVVRKKSFVPEWNGNRKEATPIVVEHRVPTMALRQELIPRPVVKIVGDVNGESSGFESETPSDTQKMVERMTLGIHNFVITEVDEETGKEESRIEIKTGKDLYSNVAPPQVGEFADELGRYYQKLLTEVAETKN